MPLPRLSKISGTWSRTGCKLQANCLELKVVSLALHHWAPLLQGHLVIIAMNNITVVSYMNRGGGGTVPLSTLSSSGLIPVATLAVPSPLGQTHSGLLQCDRRPSDQAKSASERSFHPEVGTLIFELQGLPTCSPQATAISSFNSRAQSTGVGCCITTLGRLMYMFPPFPLPNKIIQKQRGHSDDPLVAVSAVVFIPDSAVCG